VSTKDFSVKFPAFAWNELGKMASELSPVKLSVLELLHHQQQYHTKAVSVEGQVKGVVSIDETDQTTVQTWGFMSGPKTVESMASATYFYLEDDAGTNILVKYLADLDVAGDDKVAITGFFSGCAFTVEKKGLLRTEREQVSNEFGEPFITALSVENRTKQKIEYIRRTEG
jgi:hypothetical protein